ncbi:MAG: 50S ribosomal protein L25 [Actinomycetota bacterium]|nr:50S ribosomal protein L25 [Actinomycetota bacterium]MDZ4178514.1 50S ribosomal protein L25 [Coriobacteriia bacterium]
MTESTTLEAMPREVIGKASRRLASEGLIPAVLYGPAREAVSLALSRHEFELFLQHHAGSAIVALVIPGEPKPVNAMIKQIQMSPVKSRVMHVDFMAIRMDRPVQAAVTLHFAGEAPGVKEGGVVLHEVREVNVEALPANLPDFIEVDMSGLAIGSTMTVADLVVPAGVTVLDDPEGVICSVTTPMAEEAEEEAAAEPAEPAVIGEESSDDSE